LATILLLIFVIHTRSQTDHLHQVEY